MNVRFSLEIDAGFGPTPSWFFIGGSDHDSYERRRHGREIERYENVATGTTSRIS